MDNKLYYQVLLGRKGNLMYKKPRDFNAAECMIWMYAFNRGKVNLHMNGDYPRHVISLVPINQLKFPEGWYYSTETQTINKENSSVTVRIVSNE